MFKKIVKNFGPEWDAAPISTEVVCITLPIAVCMLFATDRQWSKHSKPQESMSVLSRWLQDRQNSVTDKQVHDMGHFIR